MLNLEYINNTDFHISKEFFEKILKDGYNILKKKIDGMLDFCDGVVGLILVNNEEIRNINYSHRGKNTPTDVISLSYIEATSHPDNLPTGFEMIGEIFISIDMATQQAKENNHLLEKEMKRLFVHGFLHILGFDHTTDEEESEMEEWAKKI